MIVSSSNLFRFLTIFFIGLLSISSCSSSSDAVSTAGTNPNSDDTPEPVQASLELVSDKTFRIHWQPSDNTQFYRVLENSDGLSGYSVVSEHLDASTQFFDHRVALYKRTNARYIVQACNMIVCVDSDELIVTGQLEDAVGYLKASDSDDFMAFGASIALDGDGNTLAVSSLFSNAAVQVFTHNNGRWELESILGNGSVTSISADGNTLTISRYYEGCDQPGRDPRNMNTDINGNPITSAQCNLQPATAGAVYIFVRDEGNWSQQARLISSRAGFNNNFGSSTSLSSDGNTLIIGEPRAMNLAGAAHVYTRNNGVWREQSYLQASNPGQDDTSESEEGDLFGSDVSVSANGLTIAVGAPYEDSAVAGINGDQANDANRDAGAVYIFERISESWEQQAYIKSSNPDYGDWFGGGVSLSENGDTLAVGAIGESSGAAGINGDQSDNTETRSGAIYIFESREGSWQQQTYIKASNTDDQDFFGTPILSADGNTLLARSRQERSAATGINGDQSDNSAVAAGAAYVFVKRAGEWQQRAYLKASNTEANDLFGESISLSADGNTVAVGAIHEAGGGTGNNADQNDNSIERSGAVYLY